MKCTCIYVYIYTYKYNTYYIQLTEYKLKTHYHLIVFIHSYHKNISVSFLNQRYSFYKIEKNFYKVIGV